jgi:nitronate monooxygenase
MALSSLPPSIAARLTLPLIAAPMFRVSGDDLVVAACRAGVIGAFPTANCRSVDELDRWLTRFETELGPDDAPYCPNLIIRRAGLADDVACLRQHRVELVITSVGSPEPVIDALHEAGGLILADVASLRHAEKAVRAGADGLVLLTAGAGGQTGWANGFAFVRAVREWYDGIVVLAGGIADGQALFAARALGCDLAYMGTKFIATRESLAAEAYKEMLVTSRLDDVTLTTAMTGLETNMLRPSMIAAGLDPDDLPSGLSVEGAAALYGASGPAAGPRRWRDIWSAGHAVSGVRAVRGAAELVNDTRREYEKAQATLRAHP